MINLKYNNNNDDDGTTYQLVACFVRMLKSESIIYPETTTKTFRSLRLCSLPLKGDNI